MKGRRSTKVRTTQAREALHLIAALSFAFITASSNPTSARDAYTEIPLEIYAKPGTLLTLPNGRRLNIRCFGSGSPTVVLTAGAGDQSLRWRSLQSELAKTTQVCAWDRAGNGFSDSSPETQDVAHTTDDLNAVLAEARIPPPYILVGHSLGGFETLMFAFQHEHDVAGIVLIDPTPPFYARRLKEVAPDAYAVSEALQVQGMEDSRNCINLLNQSPYDASVESKCLPKPDSHFPSDLNQVLRDRNRNIDSKKSEVSLMENAADNDSQELMNAWKDLGSTPLIVLTAGELRFPRGLRRVLARVFVSPLFTKAAEMQVPQAQAEWFKMHDEIAALSTRGENDTVAGATHYIYLDRQAAVVGAVLKVLAMSRESR